MFTLLDIVGQIHRDLVEDKYKQWSPADCGDDHYTQELDHHLNFVISPPFNTEFPEADFEQCYHADCIQDNRQCQR